MHGRVGVAHERVGVARRAVVGDRDADARGEEDLRALDRERRGDRLGDPLGDHHRVDLRVHVVAQDRELVAAEARDRVDLAGDAAQARRHEAQQAVAGAVAERVVD